MIPLMSTDLIAELDETVPVGVPSVGQTEQQIFFNAGQRDLINNLKLKLENQLNDHMKGE